jgi:hypothetical protein
MTRAVPRPAQDRGYEALPGWELVGPGLADLAAGRHTVPGSLVALASERLLALEIAVPIRGGAESPETLYDLVVAEVGERRAHARYNALRRRLASFISALATVSAGVRPKPEADARNR